MHLSSDFEKEFDAGSVAKYRVNMVENLRRYHDQFVNTQERKLRLEYKMRQLRAQAEAAQLQEQFTQTYPGSLIAFLESKIQEQE